jgi:hypothetical protein
LLFNFSNLQQFELMMFRDLNVNFNPSAYDFSSSILC